MRLGMVAVLKQSLNQNLLMRVIQTAEYYQLSADELNKKLEEEIASNPALKKTATGESGKSERRYLRPPDEALTPIEDRTGASETLVQQLVDGFRVVRATEEEQAAAFYILNNLNKLGFLADPLPTLAEQAAQRFDNAPSLDAFERARELILHKLDPDGCASDDVAHYLAYQFTRDHGEDPFVLDLVQNHLKALWAGDFGPIAAAMDMDEEDVEEYRHMLNDLSTHPAQGYGDADDTQTVAPDFEVEQDEHGTFVVVMSKESSAPPVEIDKAFVAKAKTLKGDEKKEADAKIREARDLARKVADRKTLLEQVAVRAVEAQQAFFADGPEHLRNLTRSSIAAEIGVDDSQVSRIVGKQYFLWRGTTYPLRTLFAYRRVVGDDTSAAQLKAMVQQIFADEDPRTPLSDRQVMDELAHRGVRCKLRTVNKYRRILGIPSSHKRRKKKDA